MIRFGTLRICYSILTNAGTSHASASQEAVEERIRPLALLLGQHESAITSMACSYDGNSPVLISADSAGTLCVWRLDDGVCLR